MDQQEKYPMESAITVSTEDSLPMDIEMNSIENVNYSTQNCANASTVQNQTGITNHEGPVQNQPEVINNESTVENQPEVINNESTALNKTGVINHENTTQYHTGVVNLEGTVQNQPEVTNHEITAQNQPFANVFSTPTRHSEGIRSTSMSSSQLPAPAQGRLEQVTLTPTPQPLNPHSTMAAITPMASGCTQAKSSIKIQNCVSTVSLGCELKLLDIYCRTRFSEYNPARFQGVVMKILEPRATALVFRSGKIVCTGARNEHDSYLAARKFARIIQKLGFPAKFLDFKIQNFIATGDLRFPVRLEALQQAHGQFTSYEPELFPGLVYRMVRPRVVLLIFVNGKIVFTGGKTRNEIHEALDIIYPILRSYRKS